MHVMKMLLEHPRKDPNIRGRYGYTPLHVAAVFDHPPIIELLLQHKVISSAHERLLKYCNRQMSMLRIMMAKLLYTGHRSGSALTL